MDARLGFVLSLSLLALPLLPIHAGHTRPGYVDGCQSVDGRFVISGVYDLKAKQWTYQWKDTKTKQTLTGSLVGIADNQQGHFDVSYVHLFLAPDGETFAAWNPASWAGFINKLGRVPDRSSPQFQDFAGFKDRLVVYKKTGEIVRRLDMKDFLKDREWDHVHWVQGNLYWLGESPDYPVKTPGEPPRCGYRYYRISPDYTVLEVNVTPDREVQAKFGVKGVKLPQTSRVLRIDLIAGQFLPAEAKLAEARTPVRAWVGPMSKRGDEMKHFVPSLDPVRVMGTYSDSK